MATQAELLEQATNPKAKKKRVVVRTPKIRVRDNDARDASSTAIDRIVRGK